jgi:hypothetical protein
MKPINTPTISLPDAVARVTRFRKQLIDQVPETNIPRAILIPIDDLMAIVEKYSFVDAAGNVRNSLQGVRAYFAVKLTDTAMPDDVTALIVPVDLKGNDIISSSGNLTEGPTDIYDFTKPCPDQCDPASPLYIG